VRGVAELSYEYEIVAE